MTQLLRLDRLTIESEHRQIIKDASLGVTQGEIVAVLGETGSGKSLIGSSILGLCPPGIRVDGSIVYDGRQISAGDEQSLRELWASEIFLLPQEPLAALPPLLAIRNQVAEQFTGRSRFNAARKVLETMQLSAEHHGKRPFELSGGMAQRVLAAIASATRARVIVADEPTKGLDATRRAAVAELFCKLRDEGRAIILITHDIELVRLTADRVAFLDDGVFVESGVTNEVLTNPVSTYAQRYIASDPSGWPARARGTRVGLGDSMIEAVDLTVGFDGRDLVANATFNCRAGEITSLHGDSGLGKSSLGNALVGLLPPRAGVVRYGFPRRAGALQKLHQDPTCVFPPAQNIGRSLKDLSLLPGGQQARADLPGLMKRFGLRTELLDRRPHEVSGGEAQRLALARALAMRPRFLLADEPTSRLDPPVQAEVIAYLRAVVDEGDLSVLLVTHDPALANAVSDRSMTLLAQEGAPAAVVEEVRPPCARPPGPPAIPNVSSGSIRRTIASEPPPEGLKAIRSLQ